MPAPTPATGGVRHADLLTVYSNDHLASATGGIQLVSRMIAEHRATPYAGPLTQLLAELHEERTAIRTTMRALGVPVRRYKQVVSWVGEKVARGKLNGRLARRSPLSSVVEFEFLSAAVLGKRSGFETLRLVADVDPRVDAALFDRLVAQADRQHEWLSRARREVAAGVFGGDPGSAQDAAAR